MFLQACAKNSVHREGVSEHAVGQTPPGQTPPGRHPPEKTPHLCRHPQVDTPTVDIPLGRHPQANTPPGKTPHLCRHPLPARCILLECILVVHYYRLQRSWDKVMFLQVSVILLMGGGGTSPSLQEQTTPPRADPPRADPPGSRHLPGVDHPPGSRHHPGSKPPWSRPPWADTPRPACCEIRSTCGWYASYWNAILFLETNVLAIYACSQIDFFIDYHCKTQLELSKMLKNSPNFWTSCRMNWGNLSSYHATTW